ncbi:MAG: aldehyde ferredoxin oxidoreductase C-terminal domain-containing protein, partial [Candidatus Promineifilaceae bacterium]
GWQFMDMAQLAGMVADVTGWEFTPMDIVEVGKRTLNMQRAFNARDGVGREYDTSPAKKMLTPLKGGPSDGFIFPADKLEEYKDIYFDLAGWDEESGYPTNETLESVGLEWIAEMM